MACTTTQSLLGFILGGLCVYVYLLHRRLTTPHSLAKPVHPLSEKELEDVSYEHIDMLQSIPSALTGTGYAVIGGSGFLGLYLVRLLLLRGEPNVRIIDLHSPEPAGSLPSSVEFRYADIASAASIREALLTPMAGTGAPPQVIYHTAALIRFWERASYTWPLTYNVNVAGTQNIIEAANSIPGALLIYTSSGDVVSPRPRFARLGFDLSTPPRNTITVSDAGTPLDTNELVDTNYARSKLQAERLVCAANCDSLRTGAIRPGYTILGPDDRLLASTLMLPRVPMFDGPWSHTNICVWDAAAAHLLLEDALQQSPEEVGGQAFLVTGKGGEAWRISQLRETVRYYSKRDLIFDDVPPLLIYVLGHFTEAFLHIRFWVLSLFTKNPGVTPRWLGAMAYLQPAMFKYLADTVIDDSRARKVLRYRPQWDTAQTIKWSVDEMQSGNNTQSKLELVDGTYRRVKN